MCEVALARDCGAEQGRASCLIFDAQMSDYAGLQTVESNKISDSSQAKTQQ
jgi:hypothetical protein